MNYIRESTGSEDLRTKRQHILDAAYVVFSRKGYHRATVDEIIALADTGKGTVYNYFVNKEQLFYTLIMEKSAPFEAALMQLVAAKEPALEKVEKAVKLFLHFFMENGDLWRVMMHEIRGLSCEKASGLKEGQKEKYQDWFNRTIGALAQILQDGIAQETIRDCDVTKSAYGLFSVILMMVFQKFVGDDISGMAHMTADIFLYGIAKK
ncbi:tetr bacterial regulatory protein hth signature [Lucifera butyrica]|uniref:Tetr bacterial regulatory protein hth signature n=1 Tax=Lucifera butyrica TaxID=1351585 RepID=A0A498R9N2_9FIRM|nr:TetR/AcrR family transcriptional regulator [Lucifera butyrica]VBB05848.1 tetr bacterial regulatory protein hth signature [Lucifera butyrica]